MEKETKPIMGDDTPIALNEDTILQLNFVPQWARKPPGALQFESRDEERGRRGASTGGRRGRWDDEDGARDGRGRGEGRDRARRARHEADRPAHGGRAREDRSASLPPTAPPESRPLASHDRKPAPRSEFNRPPPVELAPVTVRFFPDQKQLSAIVRQLISSRRAYPLMDIATLFFSKPAFACVKLEPVEGPADTMFYQCKSCRAVTLDRETMESHIVAAHRDDYFQREDIEGEAPGGDFVCVAKCGLTGILLGPPNHHSYAEKIQEIHRTRFPQMSMETYRSRIQTSRDPELIEAWRQEVRKTTVFKLKESPSDQPVEPMKPAAAEAYMREHVVPLLTTRTRRAVLSVSVARDIEDRRLFESIRDAWNRESRHPRSLVFALRAALRHKHMHLFKAGQGAEYVTAIAPAALDPTHTIESIQEVLAYLRDHPGCHRAQLVEALRPGEENGSPRVAEVLSPLSWLIEKGHLIEFFDGSLAVPMEGSPERHHEDA